MALPPFPAQDLAKLVLGYLMEEQLMTAYDEFLQASPYLDAFTNEYDRLCMISLKNILAEYRAMRLLVETSKPIALRRKLLQCTNLIEMLKLLIINVDLKKMCEYDPVIEKPRVRTSFPVNKTKSSVNDSLDSRMSDSHPMTTIDVNATPLADLPGNIDNVRNSINNVSEMQRHIYQRQMEHPGPTNNYNTQFTMSPSKSQVQCSTTNVYKQGIPLASSFNDFATGVGGNSNVLLSDCSTPDNSNVKLTHIRSGHLTNILSSGSSSKSLLTPMNTLVSTNNIIEGDNTIKEPKTKDNQKITILSNIKVDTNKLNVAKVIENQPALLQKTQTIYVNGTAVYKSDPEVSNKFTFTDDEIMAMPTLIVVPGTVAGDVALNTVQVPPSVPLNPLTIDVPPNVPTIDVTNEPDTISIPKDTPQSQNLLLKTADNKVTSLPPTCQVDQKPTTPVMSRPLRKSSSTPRRSSHIRVLDFNTPRRILERHIQGNVQGEIETVVSKSPDLNLEIGKPVEQVKNTEGKDVEHVNKKKKKNWDEDLRRQIVEDCKLETPKTSKKKRKPKENSNTSSKSKAKTKQTKTNRKSTIEKIEDSVSSKPFDIPIKPTINLITDTTKKKKSTGLESEEGDKVMEPPVNTPENETMCLQNAIGAKLNISDFLETPFKQALYDLQMDTPRFFGPDIGSGPVSDIKITNIPTPTFLNTPKLSQNTPSSYSSRPTDYSSGGSYYKPDYHECPNLLEDIDIPSSSSLDLSGKMKVLTPATDSVNVNEKTKSTSKKRLSSRPVRQCTKNVSYYNSPFAGKPKSPRKSNSDDSKEYDASDEIKVKEKVKFKERRKSFTSRTPKIKAKLKSSYIKSPLKENIIKHKNIINRKRTSSKDKEFITPIIVSGPTKSRRKSSTPRKLHCTKAYNANAEFKITYKSVQEKSIKWNVQSCMESDLNTDVEDITKIRDFIEKSQSTKIVTEESSSNIVKVHIADDSKSLHADLIKRGFDAEVARAIEKDLTDCSPTVTKDANTEGSKANFYNEIEKPADAPTTINLSSDLDVEEVIEDLEFSVHECNEESSNFTSIKHEEGSEYRNEVSFKNNFTMDICIEDVVIRLNATPFIELFNEEPEQIDEIGVIEDNFETEAAVRSISYINKLYTPRKIMTEEEKAKCRDIFDSSLHSLDTPLKATSPRYEEELKKAPRKFGVTEVTLEVEAIDEEDTTAKEQSLPNKRKRLRSESSSEDTNSETKKSKTQYLKNIQNFDIESVLSRLHGP